MKTSDVVAFYGSKTAVADALQVHKSAVSNWGELVPRGRAFELEKLTKGKLRVDLSLYSKQRAA
ncbi:Cro/CI family transcriptional regulator [Rheinheimera sp.]|uniref:Cro/CI family transcriptional regulator n=1 Tax=Rheinheimera sp. TaxID=1869214 RepID=UPI003D285358